MSARNLRMRSERLIPRAPECAATDERVEAVASSGPASCSAPRWPLPAKLGCNVGSEEVRARLIGEISRIVREPVVPDSTRAAAHALIGWLARRFPGETPPAIGVEEAVRARSARARANDDEPPSTERNGSSDPQHAESERRISVPRRRAR